MALLSFSFFFYFALFVLCTFFASCMLIQHTLIVPCTLIAYFHSMCHCDPFHFSHFILTSRFCFLVAVRALPTLGTNPFVHGPTCSMHLLTICNTILVWGILVAHLTPLSHRCSLHYVQSQFSFIHYFIPNYLLFPDTLIALHALFRLCTLVTLCHFVYTFSLMYTHCPTYAHPLIHAQYFFILLIHLYNFISVSSCSIQMLLCTYTCCSCILLA